MLSLISILVFSGYSKDEPEPEITKIPSNMDVAFPDPAFRDYILSTSDADGDGVISEEEALEVERIYVVEKNVFSLEGIMQTLQTLYIKNGSIISNLGKGSNTEIKYVD